MTEKKVPKKNPLSKGRGRPAGTPNRTTIEFKDAVNRVLNHAAPKMVGWLDDVASGNIEDGGKRESDPGKALDLLAKLAEYVAPKLNRTEVSGPDGGPVQVTSVKRTIIDVHGT